MSRYIDADNIRKPIYAEEDNCTGIGMTFDEMDAYNEGIDAVIRRIDSVPTADVKEVVHGEWIEGYYGIECSNCGREVVYREGDDGRWHYEYFCPHCGADLRGENNEP